MRLAVLAVLLAAVAAFSYETNVRAGEPIDLNGDWTVIVEGDIAITCTANVEQSPEVGGALPIEAQLRCPGAPVTALQGELWVHSGYLSLHPRGEQGLDIDIIAFVDDNSSAVDGVWQWGGGTVDGTFHAVRGLTPQPRPDLVGSWDVQTSEGTGGACTADLTDDRLVVRLTLRCPNSPDTEFAGPMNGVTVDLTSGDNVISVTATSDGLAMAGRWIVREPCCTGGSFTGLKRSDHSFEGDATGDWTATLATGLFPPCDVAVEQSGDEVFAAFDCGLAGGYWLRGSIDPETATFELEGLAGSEKDMLVIVRGVISDDGQSFAGTASGITVEGERVDDTPTLIDISGARILRLITQYGEEVACDIEAQQTHEVLSIPIECAGVGSGTLDGWISPLTGEMMLEETTIGDMTFSLTGEARASEGGSFIQGKWQTKDPLIRGCFTSGQFGSCDARFVGALPGDANCDHLTNSLDAAIVLQVVAGLVDLGDLCDGSEGVYLISRRCCPATINAVDAALILQIGAGLFGRLAG